MNQTSRSPSPVRPAVLSFFAALIAFLSAVPAFSAALLDPRAADAFGLFREEAQVVSAARRPTALRNAPATVHVITGQQIRALGAQNLWDALRTLPGVDVMTTRTGQGEVSIRGLDKALNNRTLVLLDGKTVMNGYFDFVTWESIPVTLEEVDRIEVVEGPASALYGPNAENGVINIITKTPRQLKGVTAAYGYGERQTHHGSLLYGGGQGPLQYKIGLGWDSTHRFEQADALASEAGKMHGMASYRFSRDTDLSLSGGWSHIDTQVTTGGNGATFGEGPSSFVRMDLRHRDTRFRFFWNQGGTQAKDLNALQDPNLDYDTYDLDLEQTLRLPFSNTLVAGANYRKNVIDDVGIFPGDISQDLWALFLEDEWRFWDQWTLAFSGRMDHHPFTGLVFSPRGSLIFNPVPNQTLRFSAGTSFRNPTLLENYLRLTQTLPNPGTAAPNPPFSSIQSTFLGNTNLDPEEVRMFELAYTGHFGRLRLTAAGFQYRVKDLIETTPMQTSFATPPTLGLVSSFANQGTVRAWGGELGSEIVIFRPLSAFANYSYESLTDDGAPSAAASSPRHKIGAGLLAHRGGWSGSFWGQWVDETFWNQNPPSVGTVSYGRVPDYLILNARAAYAFSGRLRGLEVALSVFNLADREHYEILPAASPFLPGQNGEIVRSRWMGTVTYHFQ